MFRWRTSDRTRGKGVIALCVCALAAASCSSGPRGGTGRDVGEPPPPKAEPVRSLPVWVDYPHLHPERPASDVIGAAGRSAQGPIDAENDALDALVDAIVLRVDAAHQRAEPLHPYFAYEGEFADVVTRRLEPSSPMVASLLGTAEVDGASRVVHEGINYAFAYIDRRSAGDLLERRTERQQRRVEEAVDIAMNAAELDNWFGFVRWSRQALVREAERVALLVLRDAMGDPAPLDAFSRTYRLEWVKIAADTLRAHHGWTLHTEFEWSEPPPRQMEPRINRHLMNMLLAHGLKVGFGEGCPKLVQVGSVLPWPEPVPVETMGDGSGADSSASGDEAEPIEEEPEPRPHHVLEVRGTGGVTRTALASWDAVVELRVEARTCGMGPMVTGRLLGTLEGRGGRDAQAAYLRALDWERLDEAMAPRLSEMDLLLPAELVGEPPGALGAF